MSFYLGVHRPNWLEQTSVPLFISRRVLAGRKTYPRARGPWAQDSGGFTELDLFGKWDTSLQTFVEQTRRHMLEIGSLSFAAPQDWMCEPHMLKQTGLTVLEHQRRTVDNYLALMSSAPDVPWIPVLQGWQASDYERHVEMYSQAGVSLDTLPLVGVGTVCRRQATGEAVDILRRLQPIALHGFGFKVLGLRLAGHLLESSDSMAWSYNARRNPPMAGHTHKSCANCLEFALTWRRRCLASLAVPKQGYLELSA